MRLIDADLMIANGFKDKTIEVRIEDIIKSHEKVVKLLFRDVVDFINKQPTVDAVSVVRCKDCRHRDPEDHKCDSGEMERQGCPFKVADDYFCAYGERRSE